MLPSADPDDANERRLARRKGTHSLFERIFFRLAIVAVYAAYELVDAYDAVRSRSRRAHGPRCDETTTLRDMHVTAGSMNEDHR